MKRRYQNLLFVITRLITLLAGYNLIALETSEIRISVPAPPHESYIISNSVARLAAPILWNDREKTPREHIFETVQGKYVVRKPIAGFWQAITIDNNAAQLKNAADHTLGNGNQAFYRYILP
ncbi:MAG: hypothetical protein AAB731_01510 [Patescibacteria group bacterium]